METRPLLFFIFYSHKLLWIGQVIVPAVSVTAVVLANPDVRNAAKQKLDSIKQKFQSKKIRVV